MREDPSLAKLVRIMVIGDWEGKFNLAIALAIRKLTSDHVSVCLMSGEEW